MLNALEIILHETAKPSKLQEDHPMWQHEFTWFFALFHPLSLSRLNEGISELLMLYSSLLDHWPRQDVRGHFSFEPLPIRGVPQ